MLRLHRFTEIDYWQVYRTLFRQPGLFLKLAQGLPLPADILRVVSATRLSLEGGQVHYEDCVALVYLMLRMEGSSLFSGIKQVLIDEAQDYYPLHYEVFKLLFRDARFTVLGDVSQGIEREVDLSLYDDILASLEKNQVTVLHLNKSYRSSCEISEFSRKLLGGGGNLMSFARHEAAPTVVPRTGVEEADRAVAGDISSYLAQGYESVAIICKSLKEAKELYARLKELTMVELIGDGHREIGRGAMVMPVYMARGLEFDVVLVYGVTKQNYSTNYDRKLLYLACTRALHRLVLYYTGEKSPLV